MAILMRRGMVFSMIAAGGIACDAFSDPYTYSSPTSPGLSPPISSTGGTSSVTNCPEFRAPVVTNEQFYPVLYSWLSDDELDQVERTKALTQPRDTLLSTILDQWEAESGSLVIPTEWGLAKQELFAVSRVRHTWPYPWASAIGPFGTTHLDDANPSGDDSAPIVRTHLLRMVVRDEAILLVQTQSNLQARDRDGNLVTLERVLADPSRIVGVLGYHALRDRSLPSSALRGPTASTLCSGASAGDGARSILLVNPTMVKSWSVGSEAADARLEQDEISLRDYLEEMRRVGATSSRTNPACDWFHAAPTQGGCDGRFHQALAVTNDPYSPTIKDMVSLIDFMTAIPSEDTMLREDLPPPNGGAGGAIFR